MSVERLSKLQKWLILKLFDTKTKAMWRYNLFLEIWTGYYGYERITLGLYYEGEKLCQTITNLSLGIINPKDHALRKKGFNRAQAALSRSLHNLYDKGYLKNHRLLFNPSKRVKLRVVRLSEKGIEKAKILKVK